MMSPATRCLLFALLAACARDRSARPDAAAPPSAPADSLAMMGHGAALNPVGAASETLGGDVLVVPAPGGGAQVTVSVRGAVPGATLAPALHTGTCADDRGTAAPLAPVRITADGTGAAAAAVQLPPRILLDGDHFVQAADASGTPLLCADLSGG